jgi:putative tributyrin esterase
LWHHTHPMRHVARLVALIVLACGSFAACAAPSTPPGVQTFHSAALGRTMQYRVSLPAGASNAPVVYLLHGFGGDDGDWFTNSTVASAATQLGIAVVTPDGDNSWYVNSSLGRWEDYIAEDLVAEVESRFPVARTREGRAIAGLSMGGYGAVRIGLRRPARFAVAASMSGALDSSRPISVFNPRGNVSNITQVFGPPGSPIREANDVYLLAGAAAGDLPYFYLDCGTDDPWLGVNRDFAAILEARNIPHEFHEASGGHNFTYWDRQVLQVLNVLAERLR